jgi:hypothetical protein
MPIIPDQRFAIIEYGPIRRRRDSKKREIRVDAADGGGDPSYRRIDQTR